jgi:RNA polymerase sigma factor (sigma-70 family)
MVVATESALVTQAQAGDRTAFGALYDTYLPKIYDFALGMLRNRSDAEDVTSDTFLKAVERLGSLKEPEAFRGWLYAIARNSALSLIESRKRAVPTAEHDEYASAHETAVLPDPEMRAESHEMRELVWDAAATLNPRDFQVFELTVRHGLSSAEIAPILGVRPAYAYILVNRLKGSVEEALETVLLTRTGRADCEELDGLVAAYGAEATPRLRKAVARHAKSCAACTETKKTRASVPALLAGAAFAAPSAAFAAELASKIDELWDRTPPSSSSSSGTGGLGGVTGAIATVVFVVTGLVGVAAAPVHEADVPEAATPVVEKAKPTDEPTPTAEPTDAPVAQQPRTTFRPAATVAPERTPTVVIVDETDNDVDTGDDQENNDPTLPPQQTPRPTKPPIRPG